MVTPAPLRIAFFGTPEFAVPSLKALIDSRHVVAGVITQPDRAKGRGQHLQASPVKQLALSHGVPVLQPERLREPAFLTSLRDWKTDLGVVAAYGKILTDEVLQIASMGLINVHASLLPKYRGAAPVHRAVMAGDTKTGITIMRVVKALDAGPMLAVGELAIGDEQTSVEVEQGLALIGASLLPGVVENLAKGTVQGVDQDESQATYAPKIQKSDGVVDWTAPAKVIHDQIRGLFPWPHAFTQLGTVRCLLLESQAVTLGTPGPSELSPGTVIEARGDNLSVQTGDGLLRILRLQPEGRRPMTTRDFLSGHRLSPGEHFTRAGP